MIYKGERLSASQSWRFKGVVLASAWLWSRLHGRWTAPSDLSTSRRAPPLRGSTPSSPGLTGQLPTRQPVGHSRSRALRSSRGLPEDRSWAAPQGPRPPAWHEQGVKERAESQWWVPARREPSSLRLPQSKAPSTGAISSLLLLAGPGHRCRL